jgi:hypothetical protein
MRRFLMIIAAAFIGTGALAAPPTAPKFSVVDTRCSESAATCTVAISATGGNGRGSWIQATTSNGTATTPADYATRSSPIYVSPGHSTVFSFPVVNDKLIEGDEYLFVTISAKQNAMIARARGAVTIVDDDVAPPPPPPPPPPPVQCPDGSTVPAGQTCPAPPPPPPSVITGRWLTAPLAVGSYAWTASNQPQGCCAGLVFRIVGGPIISNDANPDTRQQMWQLQPVWDCCGNFPFDDAYEAGLQSWWPEKDILGLAVAP